MHSSAAAFTLESVSVRIGQTLALDDVTVEVARGASVAVTGANGSGKSTLLAVVAGTVSPTAGRMSRPPGRVAWVAQRSLVPDRLPVTVRDVVSMGRWSSLGSWRPLRSADRAIVADSLDALALGPLAARSLSALSGGQRQRTFVAQALAQRADLLLLDEPTAGLDAEALELIDAALAAECARGVTVVHATHDPLVAARADHVLALDRGVLVPSTTGEFAEGLVFGSSARVPSGTYPGGPPSPRPRSRPTGSAT